MEHPGELDSASSEALAGGRHHAPIQCEYTRRGYRRRRMDQPERRLLERVGTTTLDLEVRTVEGQLSAQ